MLMMMMVSSKQTMCLSFITAVKMKRRAERVDNVSTTRSPSDAAPIAR